MTTSSRTNNTEAPGQTIQIEEGRLGKLIIARLKPNLDLTESVEALCRQHDMRGAILRGAIGSLIDAHLEYATPTGWREMEIKGPGVEILNVSGDICLGGNERHANSLQGVVADADGKIFAGRFVRGSNLSFVTIEITLQEWLTRTSRSWL